MDDETLARRAAEGDARAFSELVRRHEAAVRSFLARLAPTGARADDLAQETFVRAWTKANSFSGAAAYRSWLFGIAWRLFLMDARSRRRESKLPERCAEGTLHSMPDAERRVTLEQGFASLPSEERAAVLLCFGHGLTHEEAARSLGVPLGTLKSRVSRGRARLANIFGGEA